MLETLQLPVPSTSAMVTYNQELRRTTGAFGSTRTRSNGLARSAAKQATSTLEPPGFNPLRVLYAQDLTAVLIFCSRVRKRFRFSLSRA